MAIKSYKPMTNGTRGMTKLDYSEEITKTTPEKSLVVTLKKKGGRNNQGKITVRHRGGGAKRKYRIIDFKRDKDGVVGTVSSIEYDPNRSANIALIKYADGEKRYIIAPKGIKVGDKIESGANADIKVGNADHELVNLGKAGRKRHMGIKPTVRGSVMNPNDHPHGGGEGRAPIGRKGPVTPWGKPALGYKTRKNKKASDKLIVRRRKK